MKHTRGIAFLLIIAAMIIIGCGGGDDEPMDTGGSGGPPAEMLGTWTFQSVTVDSVTASLDTVMQWKPGTVAAKLHIQSGGAYVYEEVNSSGGQLWFESGFVFVEGEHIDFNTQLDGDGEVNETTTMGFALGGGVFTLTEVVAGKTYVYTLTM